MNVGDGGEIEVLAPDEGSEIGDEAAAEIEVAGDRFAVVADRIAPETIMAAERVPDWL